MKIINGKWKDNNNNSIDDFNITELLEIGQKVEAVYGKQITYDRIDVISSISSLNKKEESSLAYLLKDDRNISKLIGY
jgi:hypothetical protein